jgi:hypothetical protein
LTAILDKNRTPPQNILICIRQQPTPSGSNRSGDAVILVTSRRSDDRLWRDLKARKPEWRPAEIQDIFRTGDCKAPAQLNQALWDAHRLAREFDSPHLRTHCRGSASGSCGAARPSRNSAIRGSGVEARQDAVGSKQE